MPAGVRKYMCMRTGGSTRAGVGALNPPTSMCTKVDLLPVAAQWYTTSPARYSGAWASRTSLAAAFLSDTTPASSPQPVRRWVARREGAGVGSRPVLSEQTKLLRRTHHVREARSVL